MVGGRAPLKAQVSTGSIGEASQMCDHTFPSLIAWVHPARSLSTAAEPLTASSEPLSAALDVACALPYLPLVSPRLSTGILTSVLFRYYFESHAAGRALR